MGMASPQLGLFHQLLAPFRAFLCLPLQEDLQNGEDVAGCPSCSLKIKIIYDPADLEPFEEAEE